MRVFQVQYGLLTNGERYLFFCANPEENESSEVEVLDCALSDLSNQRMILAAYERDAIVGERTSLAMLAEEAREAEREGQDQEQWGQGSRSLKKSERDRLENIREIIRDLSGGPEQGAPIEAVLQRAQSDFGMSREMSEKVLERLRNKGEAYSPDEGQICLV